MAIERKTHAQVEEVGRQIYPDLKKKYPCVVGLEIEKDEDEKGNLIDDSPCGFAIIVNDLEQGKEIKETEIQGVPVYDVCQYKRQANLFQEGSNTISLPRVPPPPPQVEEEEKQTSWNLFVSSPMRSSGTCTNYRFLSLLSSLIAAYWAVSGFVLALSQINLYPSMSCPALFMSELFAVCSGTIWAAGLLSCNRKLFGFALVLAVPTHLLLFYAHAQSCAKGQEWWIQSVMWSMDLHALVFAATFLVHWLSEPFVERSLNSHCPC